MREDASTGADAIGLGPPRLEDLIDRESLRTMIGSFEQIFGLHVRIVSGSGMNLASTTNECGLCAMVNEEPSGRRACARVVADVKRLRLVSKEGTEHPCFTGARYRIMPIQYEGDTIGRIIVGPFVDPSIESVPDELFQVSSRIDMTRVAELLPSMPHATGLVAEAVANHLVAVLDVVLWSGHKAHLTSTMHIASMRESFRELTKKNTALEQAYAKQKELDKLKSHFLATVSHELRTPLTSILGYSEMLSGGIAGGLTTGQLEFVKIIAAKSNHLLELIMSLLDLSKLESGTVMMRRGDVLIASVLNEAISTLTPKAAKKNIELEVDVPADLPVVVGDPERLRQVFINLTENAIKFTPENGHVKLAARQIDVSDSDDGDDDAGLVLLAPLRQMIEVRVIDTGIGIPEAERTKVFDPFYQVDQRHSREYEGTGLGLSIVKRLVDGHRGTVHIEANSPQGAIFVVRLPAAPASETAPQAAVAVRFAG
jgi:two-component system, NarL family, sensor histidine kinase BarA